MVLLAALLSACSSGPPTNPVPSPNPDLDIRCGIDVNLIFDRSGSVGNDIDVVTEAAQSFVNHLSGTGSRVRTVSFASTATGHPGGGVGTESIASLTWSMMDGYQVPDLTAGGGTNMEGGLEVARRAPGDQGDLTVVFTDGKPNEHYLLAPDGHPGVWANLGDNARNFSLSEANALKAQGSHIFAIGVGEADSAVLAEISGPDELSPEMPIEQADYTVLSATGQTHAAFQALAKRLCMPSLTITKVIEQLDGDQWKTPGWEFSWLPSEEPASWVQPAEYDPSQLNYLVTGPSGSSTIAWDPLPGQVITFQIREVIQVGYLFGHVSCTMDLFDGNGPQPFEVEANGDLISVPVGPGQAVHCTYVNTEEPPGLGNGGDVSFRVFSSDGEGEHPAVGVKLQKPAGDVEHRSIAVGGVYRWRNLAAGPHVLAVSGLPSGWGLAALRCGGVDGNLSTGAAVAVVADGVLTSCEVQVVRTPASGVVRLITHSPSAQPGASTEWALTGADRIPRPRTVPIPGEVKWDLDPGPFLLAQAGLGGTAAPGSVDCDDGTSGPASGVQLQIAAGAIITCQVTYTT